MNKEEILSEIDKIKYLYRFKKIIRYSQERVEKISTESDAEHIFGMMILANYFLNTEFYKKEKYDKKKIYDLILFHEMDELELGDINTYNKTEEDVKNAKESLKKVFNSIPENLEKLSKENLWEYENQKTQESKFVFWIDKIEPIFHLVFNREMAKNIFQEDKLDYKKAYEKKFANLKDSGLMLDFLDVLFGELKECFYKEKNKN